MIAIGQKRYKILPSELLATHISGIILTMAVDLAYFLHFLLYLIYVNFISFLFDNLGDIDLSLDFVALFLIS